MIGEPDFVHTIATIPPNTVFKASLPVTTYKKRSYFLTAPCATLYGPEHSEVPETQNTKGHLTAQQSASPSFQSITRRNTELISAKQYNWSPVLTKHFKTMVKWNPGEDEWRDSGPSLLYCNMRLAWLAGWLAGWLAWSRIVSG